jgi:2,4-diketo-3-deoxy-L-fuconate hydrolase
MKLIRFGNLGNEKPGLLTAENKRIDLSSKYKDWDMAFFQNSGLEELSNLDISGFPEVPDNVRWAACIARPGKVICIGLNYSDHAAESGMPLP